MPRYFFHLRDGAGYVPDEEGLELPDLEAARSEAVRAVRSLLSADVMEGRLDLRGRIEVTDGSDAVVVSVAFGEAVHIQAGELPSAEETKAS